MALRIALVYSHFNLTGSLPRQQVELARYLVKAGHDVHVYFSPAGSKAELASEATFHEVPAAPVSGSRLGLALHVATFARSATRMIERDRAAYDLVHGRGMSTWEQDIVHVTGVTAGEIARDRAARDGRVGPARRMKDALLSATAPIVPVRQAIERRIFEQRIPIEIHTSSPLIRDDLLDAYDLDPTRIRVVPPGVSLEEFHPLPSQQDARRTAAVSGDQPVILFCGHSWKRKGLDRAIHALARMQNPAQLLVVGNGDIKHYRELARAAGVAERVRFAGPRTDTWRYFQAADVFVLPTRVDMWGMTIAEAMASEVPPVTTTAAGAADLIADGESGFVLPEPLDVDLLASTCDRLVADPELRHHLGLAAAEKARTLTWECHGRRVEAAMHRVAEERQESISGAMPDSRR